MIHRIIINNDNNSSLPTRPQLNDREAEIGRRPGRPEDRAGMMTRFQVKKNRRQTNRQGRAMESAPVVQGLLEDANHTVEKWPKTPRECWAASDGK